MKEVADDRVRIYVVWDPIFGGNFDGEAKNLSKGYPDKRVSYFKDADSLVGKLWEQTLKTVREIVWDAYLLYDASAKWEKEPPQPNFWMHQLYGVTIAPHFDQKKFTEELKSLLNKIEPKQKKEEKQ